MSEAGLVRKGFSMSSNPIISALNIDKSFPGVHALSKVSLDIYAGEVHALLGENGSGKSTLLKIIAGIYRHDDGDIIVNGIKQHRWSSQQAKESGIAMIHQELSLFPDLSVAENVFIEHGSFVNRYGLIDWKHLRKETKRLLEYLKAPHINPTTMTGKLSVAEQQIVEIAKALAVTEAKVILMDEPTSALSFLETQNLLSIIKSLKNDGMGIVFISHRMDEVFKTADRITVFRDGQLVESTPAPNLDRPKAIKLMVGRDVSHISRRTGRAEQPVLKVRSLAKADDFSDISFTLRKGEILGVFGLVGAGRTEIMESLFGIRDIDSGEILLDDQPISISSPSDAMRHGFGLVPEDRGTQGLILDMNLYENATLTVLNRMFPSYVLKRKSEMDSSEEMFESLSLRYSSVVDKVDSLSGGNKQKVVLAKWMLTNARIIIFDEPTKGIDVGAKEMIYQLMDELTAKGIGIIMISSELPEILKMSDRVIVISKGRLTGEFKGDDIQQDSIMHAASPN